MVLDSTMASKLFKTIGNATPLHNVGRLRYFDRSYGGKDLNVRALDFGSNRAIRRFYERTSQQVTNKDLVDLLLLVHENDAKTLANDFYILERDKNQKYALEQLRLYLVEAHIVNELVRIAYDPTAPLPKQLPLLATDLLNAFELVRQATRQALERLNQYFRFIAFKPAIQLPQRLPNAPNTATAFSLVAA